ncbi:GPI ethanolamine phosphate transferase 1 [Macrosteles quadrilineatus]|uniref:GPI ethanolamine phosphate transferase 1 n=1 Tax=Macrosteles quadrilineatus TaxID=74068 RepID=UPI0023E34DB4|nr:GPI ethanolamine phosphate transferase 1 [Macrosteles quadrilineatus]
MKVILFGFSLHIVFLLSVFDIYFKSPIVHNIQVQQGIVNPPAKRVVLFVADGLRADSLFSKGNNEYPSPYIRSIIESRGSWGVAHSRVPTESRPGHIALIAGFYEDPSAVFTGWKDNLIEFDSVFNRSYVTYSWGSPDILPMFKKGAAANKVHILCYDAEDENFSGQGSTRLNTWVFDKFEEFLKTAKNDVVLYDSLNRQGVVFFLHLLGPDVAGHANKPHSRQYRDNINVVDEGVKRVEQLIGDFYEHDNKTAFVYTSDHGMTDWGSHGAGSKAETEVPLVVWGAGVAGPLPPATSTSVSPPQWGLGHLLRKDLAQADVCPLMSVLIGVPIPVHSVGVLPLDYLSIPDHDRAAAKVQNAYQLTAQFDRKRETVESNLMSWLYKPFPDLPRDRERSLRRDIDLLTRDGEFDAVLKKSQELIQLSLAGLDYYHSYFQSLLLGCVTVSFLGWIGWLFCQLMQKTSGTKKSSSTNDSVQNLRVWPDYTFLFLGVLIMFFIFVQSLPVQFHLYCCLPLLLWWSVLRQVKTVQLFTKYSVSQVICSSAIYVVLLELLVLTFFHRWVLSLVVAVVGLWPFFLAERRTLLTHNVEVYWLLSCLTLAVFPALPVVGQQTQPILVVGCAGLWVLFGSASIYLLGARRLSWPMMVQVVMVCVTTVVIYSTDQHFETGLGLQPVNQLAAWSLLVVSVMMPMLTSAEVPVRFLSIGLGLAVPYLLLCVGHEAFFFLSLFVSLCIWLLVEANLSQVKISKIRFEDISRTSGLLSTDDFRKCFFFLMFIILSFFGTGNIASVNSFDVSWVRCFLTVFSPFTMMTLILLKTVIPFLLVTCSFRAVNIFSEVKAEKMLVIVLIYCDLMGLHFLYLVTNQGSWLEIGTSVSHFVIMEVTVLFLACLYHVARLYTDTNVHKRTVQPTTITPMWIPPSKNHPD